MLCVVPLLFRDAFFDINRIKVTAVCCAIPVFVLLLSAARLMDARRSKRSDEKTVCVPFGSCRLFMLLLMGACVLSCALAGFDRTVLDGSEGRYCGLIFMLCCGAAFFIISSCRSSLFVAAAACVCAALIALLGVLNAMGIDPLGFYVRIRKGSEHVYLSTIGHFDFFGTYLVMLLPVSGAFWLFVDQKAYRYSGLICASAIMLGAAFSRTDSAFLGVNMACFMLLALSGNRLKRIAGALWLWSIAYISVSSVYPLIVYSPYYRNLYGLPQMLCETGISQSIALVMAAAAVVCSLLEKKGIAPPGRKHWLVGLLAVFFVFAALAVAVFFYFSIMDTQTDLGAAESFLRFSDTWGSYRGFAYTRSIRAFCDFSWIQKLFGAGMERTLRVLTPYFDNPDMLVTGVFNDPHCQLLQMLLTCGLLGMAAFTAIYLSALAVFFRHTGEDPLLCGVLASLWSYSVVMLINVTQPILILTYFSIMALGISRLNMLKKAGGNDCES